MVDLLAKAGRYAHANAQSSTGSLDHPTGRISPRLIVPPRSRAVGLSDARAVSLPSPWARSRHSLLLDPWE